MTLPDRDYNQFVLYMPLPWTPTPGLDTFYVSGMRRSIKAMATTSDFRMCLILPLRCE